jgi:Protein of unknwon function (DUF3310)
MGQNINDDPVNPAYYKGDYVMRIIEDFELGFHLGTVIKYVLRAGSKGPAIQDFEKARWYLDRFIKHAGASAERAESKESSQIKREKTD